jgi:4-diphosphocytidyl-2C-methyl-D-erythritol kinase
VPAKHSYVALLILPEIHLSTADVYGDFAFKPIGQKGDEAWDRWLEREADELQPALFNDLEGAAFGSVPALAELFDRIVGMGLPDVRMTGSGSAMFHLFSSPADAQRWATRIESVLGVRTRVTQTLTTDNLARGDFYGHFGSTSEIDSGRR